MYQSTRLTGKWIYKNLLVQLQDPLIVKLVIISWFLRDWTLLVVLFIRGGEKKEKKKRRRKERKALDGEVEGTSETPLTFTEAVVKEIGRSVNFFTVGVDQTQRRVRFGVVSIADRRVSS